MWYYDYYRRRALEEVLNTEEKMYRQCSFLNDNGSDVEVFGQSESRRGGGDLKHARVLGLPDHQGLNI